MLMQSSLPSLIIYGCLSAFFSTACAISFSSVFNLSPDFTTPTFTSFNQHPVFMADIDGDRMADIVGINGNQVMVAFSNGRASFTSPTQIFLLNFSYTSYDDTPVTFGDFNDDGLDDLILFGLTDVIIYFSNGRNPGLSTINATNVFTKNGGWGWNTQTQFPRFSGDFNGDGKRDLSGVGYSAIQTMFSQGISVGSVNFDFQTASFGQSSVLNNFNRYPVLVGDFDGDGLDDLIGMPDNGVYVAFSLGNGNFTNPVLVSTAFCYDGGFTDYQTYPRMVRDLNRDGKMDLIGFGGFEVDGLISNGRANASTLTAIFSHFVNSTGWTSFDSKPRAVADVDGDGFLDIIGFDSSGVLIAFGGCADNTDCFNHESCIANGTCIQCISDSNCTVFGLLCPYCAPNSNCRSSLTAKFLHDKITVPDSQFTVPLNIKTEGVTYNITWTLVPNIVRLTALSDSVLIDEIDPTSQDIPADRILTLFATIITNQGCNTTLPIELEMQSISPALKGVLTTVKALSTATMAAAGLSLSMGTSTGLINMLRLLLYILLFNVNYPQIVDEFLSTFSSSRIPIPNLISLGGLIQLDSESLPSPKKFYDHNYDGLFLITGGPMITLMLCYVVLGWLAKIFKRCIKLEKLVNLFGILEGNTTWQGFVTILVEIMSELVLATALQIRVESNDNTLKLISSIIGTANIALLVIVSLSYYKMLCNAKSQTGRGNNGRIQEALKDYHSDRKFCRLVPWFTLMKTSTTCVTLVLLYEVSPIAQVFCSLGMEVVYAMILMGLGPIKMRYLRVATIFQEILFIFLYSVILLMAIAESYNGMTPGTKMSFGFTIIALVAGILLIEMVKFVMKLLESFGVVKHSEYVFKTVKKTRRVKRPNRQKGLIINKHGLRERSN